MCTYLLRPCNGSGRVGADLLRGWSALIRLKYEWACTRAAIVPRAPRRARAPEPEAGPRALRRGRASRADRAGATDRDHGRRPGRGPLATCCCLADHGARCAALQARRSRGEPRRARRAVTTSCAIGVGASLPEVAVLPVDHPGLPGCGAVGYQ